MYNSDCSAVKMYSTREFKLNGNVIFLFVTASVDFYLFQPSFLRFHRTFLGKDNLDQLFYMFL
jgi:hypothetical protein